MQRKHSLILYHLSVEWWPCATGLACWEHRCNGSKKGGWLSDVTRSGHPWTTPALPPLRKWLICPPGFLWAHGEKGNNSAAFYWGNKENREMRSRTKRAVSALQSGRQLPGLQGLRDGFSAEDLCLLNLHPATLPAECSSWLFHVR